MRAAIYVRVSSKKQADGDRTSLAEQERILTEIATRHGWEIEVFREVRSAGDGATGLPILTSVLGRITQGEFQRLLAYRLDRLSRGGVGDGERLKAILAPLGCEIVTAAGDYDPNDEGDDLRSDVEWLMAKQENKIRFARTYGALEVRAKQAIGRAGHSIPYGYRVVWAPDGKSSHVEVVEHEAPLIREAYELFLARVGGPAEIASRLNRQGHRRRDGKPFNAAGVGYWLRNPRYTGAEFRRSDHSGWRKKRRKFARETDPVMTSSDVWPRIIDPATFELAREVWARRRERKTQPTNSPLGGILRCPKCGGPMDFMTKKPDNIEIYRCRARVHRKACTQIPIRADEAHKGVWRWLKRTLANGFPSTAPVAIRPSQRAALEAELAELTRQEDRLTDLLVREVIDEVAYARRRDELRTQRDQLRAMLAAEPPQATSRPEPPRVPPEVLAHAKPETRDEAFVKVVRGYLSAVTLEDGPPITIRDQRKRKIQHKSQRVIAVETVNGRSWRRHG